MNRVTTYIYIIVRKELANNSTPIEDWNVGNVIKATVYVQLQEIMSAMKLHILER